MSTNFLLNKGHVLKREVIGLIKKFSQFSNVSVKEITSDYTILLFLMNITTIVILCGIT
jgi:hypothetical protein